MKCMACAKPLEKKMKFCPYCGQKVDMLCPHCGAVCQPDYVFCASCGVKISANESEIVQHERPLPTAPEVKSKFAFDDSQGDLRKHATVLFADVKGSTAMVEGLDPEEAKNILIPIIDIMCEAVYRFGGTMIKTAGDGVVAVFGAPQALEDHALRACFAALSIQENVGKHNPSIKIRVGLHSGEVYLEMIGDEHNKIYDIAGQTVNLAARMEQTAKPGTIQITHETLLLVENDMQAVSLGSIEVKGFSAPVAIYELQAVSTKQIVTQIKDGSSLLPFIGRSHDMEVLINLAKQAVSGHGSAAGIIGEAGQGKSRLLQEFLQHEYIKDHFEVILTSCFSHTQHSPYFPIINAFQKWMGIGHKDNPENIRRVVQDFFSHIEVAYAQDAILVLLGLHSTDASWNQLDPALKRKYQIETIKKIFLTAALKKPLILIIEDLHWKDQETEAFIDAMISELQHARIFLIISQRPDYFDRWARRNNYTQIRLSPLSKNDVSNALGQLLGANPALESIKAQLMEVCAGNPFFLEEMIKSLINSKILIGSAGHFELSEQALTGKINLPESIFAILQAQLDGLSALERKTLRIASVIGQRFTNLMLAKIMEEESSEIVQQVLRQLSSNEYIYETRIYPEPESAFKHALIHEVAYNSLLKSLRRSIHNKILSVLETIPDEDQDFQLIAYHAYHGENWEKAFQYYHKAATHCFFELSANKSAAELYEMALSAAIHLPKSPVVMKQCLQIHMFLITIYRRLLRLQDEGRHVAAMKDLFSLEENTHEFAIKTLFYLAMGSYYLACGDIDQSRDSYFESTQISLLCDDSMMQAVAESLSAYIYIFTGDYNLIQTKLDHALQMIPTLDYRHPLFPLPIGHYSNWNKYWAYAYTGNYPEGCTPASSIQFLVGSTDINHASIDSVYVLMAIGWVCFYQEIYEQALDYLMRAYQLSAELEILQYIPAMMSAIAISKIKLNRLDEGKEMIEQVQQTLSNVNSYIPKMLALDLITESLYLSGDYPLAKQYCQQAVRMANRFGLTGTKATLMRLNAAIDLQLPNPNYQDIKLEIMASRQQGEQLGMLLNSKKCQLLLDQIDNMTTSSL